MSLCNHKSLRYHGYCLSRSAPSPSRPANTSSPYCSSLGFPRLISSIFDGGSRSMAHSTQRSASGPEKTETICSLAANLHSPSVILSQKGAIESRVNRRPKGHRPQQLVRDLLRKLVLLVAVATSCCLLLRLFLGRFVPVCERASMIDLSGERGSHYVHPNPFYRLLWWGADKGLRSLSRTRLSSCLLTQPSSPGEDRRTDCVRL